MTDQKPTGVFVRLPLSEEQISAADAIAKEIAENNAENEWRFARHHFASCDNLVRSMGASVQGEELPIVAYEHALSMEFGQRHVKFSDTRENPWGTPGEDFSAEYETPPRAVVYQDKAQALLAARDAEIAEEQRISNLRADAVERWTNTCAQQGETIDGLRAEIARLQEALTVKDDLHMGAALNGFYRMRGYSDLEKVRAAVTAYCNALKGGAA